VAKPDISGITPFFIVKNVPAALAFYRDRLGLRVGSDRLGYHCVHEP
jgi:catechol 2,3-dioxygenase-like lactoylglutathione lyase family enzyme